MATGPFQPSTTDIVVTKQKINILFVVCATLLIFFSPYFLFEKLCSSVYVLSQSKITFVTFTAFVSTSLAWIRSSSAYYHSTLRSTEGEKAWYR